MEIHCCLRCGVYGGSVLYADFSGNPDSCLAIRTLYMNGEQGHFQAGEAIVADSVPEKEFEESVNQARAVLRAIERATTWVVGQFPSGRRSGAEALDNSDVQKPKEIDVRSTCKVP